MLAEVKRHYNGHQVPLLILVHGYLHVTRDDKYEKTLERVMVEDASAYHKVTMLGFLKMLNDQLVT